jgi:hypothetical protein
MTLDFFELNRRFENNAVFGDFESDWFEQEYGVKQGCVVFPTLFSVLMNDLVDMLRQSNFGIDRKAPWFSPNIFLLSK